MHHYNQRHTICMTSYKMKIQKPLLKRQKKGAVKGTIYISLFPFVLESLSTCGGVLFFLFNVILSKEKLKFEMSMNLTAHLYFVHSLKCKYKSNDFICRVTEITLFIFCSSYICFSLLPEQWKCFTELTQLFSFHFLICIHFTNTLYL